MKPLDQLSNEQIVALAEFASRFGRQWKQEVRNNWESSVGDFWLRQIRNKIGPTGLSKITTQQLMERAQCHHQSKG